MIEALQRWARERGYAVAWGPGEEVERARAEIRARLANGELDDGFFASELAPLGAAPIPAAGRTVIVVATPAPAHLVRFELAEGALDAVLPPTYLRYRPHFEEVRQDLGRHGMPGARLDHLDWPLKAVAARLGLVRYGRNNVGYAPGLGSWVQLCGFLTDAPLDPPAPAPAAAPSLLDECDGCQICTAACPTGAIADDRVLLHAERCVTWINENPGPWPDWLPAWAHTCLLGCLECQRACPANPPLPVVASGVEFTAAETATLLAAEQAGPRAESGIRAKLAWLGQPYAEPVLGRNLTALLAARRRACQSKSS